MTDHLQQLYPFLWDLVHTLLADSRGGLAGTEAER